MATYCNYCNKYFYPEIYKSYNCEHDKQRVCPCECPSVGGCSHKLYLSNEQFAILNSLRIVKRQNLEILKQNKQIMEELALQQLQKYK